MENEFYDIRILKNGTWLYGGTPIHRMNMVKLFASVLKKDDQGGYWLQTPVERGRIVVEDAPFTAVEMKVTGQGRDMALDLRTNLDEWVAVGASNPLRVQIDPVSHEPAPYVLVRDNLEARIVRAVYYDLAAIAQEEDKGSGRFGLYSRGVFYPIGQMTT